MTGAGIFPGDIAVVDRSRDAGQRQHRAGADRRRIHRQALSRRARRDLAAGGKSRLRRHAAVRGSRLRSVGRHHHAASACCSRWAGPLALVDCNNFYASCERVFQPELRGRPVVVLSNNDGCVIARTNEAKALGIAMGAPWHLHRDAFESAGVIVRSSNYTLYGDMSARVMRVLAASRPSSKSIRSTRPFWASPASATPRGACARAARDGAAMDRHPGLGRHRADQDARQGRQPHREERPDTRRRACCCSTKPRRTRRSRAWSSPISGASPAAWRRRLDALGIMTPLDLEARRSAFHPRTARRRRRAHGAGAARHAVHRSRDAHARSQKHHRLALLRPRRHDAAGDGGGGRQLHRARGRETAPPELATAASRSSSRPTASSRTSRSISRRGRCSCRSRPPTPPSSSRAARAASRAIWRPGYRYKKAGVMLLDLHPANRVQAGLFDRPDDARRIALMRTLDSSTARYGRDTLRFAAAGRRQPGRCSAIGSRRATRRTGRICCGCERQWPRWTRLSLKTTLGRRSPWPSIRCRLNPSRETLASDPSLRFGGVQVRLGPGYRRATNYTPISRDRTREVAQRVVARDQVTVVSPMDFQARLVHRIEQQWLRIVALLLSGKPEAAVMSDRSLYGQRPSSSATSCRAAAPRAQPWIGRSV